MCGLAMLGMCLDSACHSVLVGRVPGRSTVCTLVSALLLREVFTIASPLLCLSRWPLELLHAT